jgi:class 3 adenylate cyclase
MRFGPRFRYAHRHDGRRVAYQVVGDGDLDPVFLFGWPTHLGLMWETPSFAGFLGRLSSFSRLLLFDRSGGGLPDRGLGGQAFEDEMDDVRAVLAAVGSQRAALSGCHTGGRGREVKTTGDGLLASFDGPARAVRAADAVRAGLREVGLEVRVGLHTGEVELVGDDIGGIAVHSAARVLAHARAGEIVCSPTVKDLVAGSGFAFADRGTRSLKGVPDSWELYAVELAER